MISEETFYRPVERQRATRTMPAETYNLAHLQLARAAAECVFVPIRSMQYLAVLDAQEFIFVDREGRRLIEVAWQRFAPQTRTSLEDPVPYEVVYYTERADETMKRLQGAFLQSLRELQRRAPVPGSARGITLATR
jgi:hypothetical protein